MKKILIRGLIIALVLVGIAFISGGAVTVSRWFVPPRIYILLGIIAIVILLKIFYELRNRKEE